MSASRVWENVNHTNMCREYTAVKINACTTRRRPLTESVSMPIRAKSIWHSTPGSPSSDGHRATLASPIVGACRTVTVQGALRHDHALAGQQVADLHHRQTVVDPVIDPIMVGAQRFPRQPMPLRAVRAHCDNHRADQLVTELVNTTFTIQPRRHSGGHITPRRLAVHPGLGGHRPQTYP